MNYLESFVDLIIEQKKLQFVEGEVKFHRSLFDRKILKVAKTKISIANYEVIIPYFLDRYKEKFGFNLDKIFIKNIDFIRDVKQDFLNKGYVPNYHLLEKEIWKSIVSDSNSVYQCSFSEYLESIDTESKQESEFQFIEAYSELLPTLQLSNDTILKNGIIQLDIIKSDSHYSMPKVNILSGFKNKSKQDYDVGIDLLNKSLIVDIEKEELISAIVSGLYEKKGSEFYDSILDKLIKNENRLNPIFFGLSSVSEIKDSECTLFLDLINKNINSDSFVISTLSLVFSIIKSNNTKYHKFCFSQLESTIGNKETAYYILENLVHLNDYNQEKTEIVVNLINQNYFSIEKYINSISNVFLHLNGIEFFKKVVISLINNKPFEKFIQNFQSYLHRVDKTELEHFLIKLLIDNQASKRSTGLDIFNHLSERTPYQFTLNIIELPSIDQYKLWVSLTLDFLEPKNWLIALLPLLDSKSEFIKESFLSKLEEVSEDYGGYITKILEENLNNSIPHYALIIKRIKKYIEEYYSKNIEIKHSILELNPYHTHSKYIKSFDKLFIKNMSESIEKGAKKNSLFSIFGANTIQLSKGGGWRFGSNKEVSQLSNIGTSLIMPRSYFIYPDKFELEKGFYIKQDWKDEEFVDIKTTLEDE